MDKDKSILEKFTDTVKDIASTATEAASQALKADEPGLRVDERAVAYVPLAADGLVSDPLMVPPAAAAPERRKSASARGRRPAPRGQGVQRRRRVNPLAVNPRPRNRAAGNRQVGRQESRHQSRPRASRKPPRKPSGKPPDGRRRSDPAARHGAPDGAHRRSG